MVNDEIKCCLFSVIQSCSLLSLRGSHVPESGLLPVQNNPQIEDATRCWK